MGPSGAEPAKTGNSIAPAEEAGGADPVYEYRLRPFAFDQARVS
jgi:hypothetical protein